MFHLIVKKKTTVSLSPSCEQKRDPKGFDSNSLQSLPRAQWDEVVNCPELQLYYWKKHYFHTCLSCAGSFWKRINKERWIVLSASMILSSYEKKKSGWFAPSLPS